MASGDVAFSATNVYVSGAPDGESPNVLSFHPQNGPLNPGVTDITTDDGGYQTWLSGLLPGGDYIFRLMLRIFYNTGGAAHAPVAITRPPFDGTKGYDITITEH